MTSIWSCSARCCSVTPSSARQSPISACRRFTSARSCLLLGVIAFLSSRCVIASFATLPNLLLALLIGWGIIRTVPYLRENGFDAMRDSMLVLYGGFAFIVTALLLEKPERLQLLIKFLRIPRAHPRAARAHYRDNDQCSRPRRGRSYPVVAWPMPRSGPPPFTSPRPLCWSFWASNVLTFFGALF